MSPDPRVLLVNSPLTDTHCAYPAVAYLEGFLSSIGCEARAFDASNAVLLQLFSARGIDELLEAARTATTSSQPEIAFFLLHAAALRRCIGPVIACLQGRDHAAELLVARPGFLPPRLDGKRAWAQAAHFVVASRERRFGPVGQFARIEFQDPGALRVQLFGLLGGTEMARYLASGVLDDLAAVIRAVVDKDFQLNAYAECLEAGAQTFEPLKERLEGEASLLDRVIDRVADEALDGYHPDIVGLSVPFAGSLLGALRMARRFKQKAHNVPVVIGGGWVSAHLRHLTDPGPFDYVDYIVLDAGEQPLRRIVEHLAGRRNSDQLVRTFVRERGQVIFRDGPGEQNVPWESVPRPSYRHLPSHQYLAYRPELHPFSQLVHRPWNKLTLAHGCYWRKCAFCDTAVDYVARYSPHTAEEVVRRIEALRDETGVSGFHFVDEAMPPALLHRMAVRLQKLASPIAWWGNVRFEESLAELAPTLAASGCLALSGGLEVASDRVLALMAKGVSLGQAVRVTSALSRAGIAVHAYLIYGFPTQTDQETIDALEFVRQLYQARCLTSAVWHRFTLTAGSPVSQDPARFGITLAGTPRAPFANYVLQYREAGAPDADRFRQGLRRANGAYMIGASLDRPVSSWFSFFVPDTTLPPDFVDSHL